MKKNKFILLALFILSTLSHAQDDMLSMLDSVSPEPATKKVMATFKTTKVIGAETIETVKAKTMDFRITHRFGNIGAESGGGVHTLYGFDDSQDIRIAFDFGITDTLMVGIARSKLNENLDAAFKYRFLEQTSDNKMPLSVAFYEDIVFSPKLSSQFYSGTVNSTEKVAHRFSYLSQIILARKFNSAFSLEFLPTYIHRNYITPYLNADGKEDKNGLFSLGIAGRIKLSKRFAILAEYFYPFSDYRKNNDAYNAPLSIGIEIETGGHVFHLNFTNASGIIANEFIPNTTDNWFKGGFKFGFNISRVFNL